MLKTRITAPFKYPGAKWQLADWITSFFPQHNVYLEPFFGSGAVFFRKMPVRYETINDLDGRVVNFYRVCRDKPEELARVLALTPYSREEFEIIQEACAGEEIQLTGEPVEDARRFIVRCSQGFGSKMAGRVGWKNTKHSEGPSNPRVWSRVPETVLLVAERLKNAQIENRPAVELIEGYNAPDCLIYADPPYLRSTRGSRIYSCEMESEDEHATLLDVLLKHKGPVILSGYDNDLYNEMLTGWHKEQITTHADGGAARTETLWMNFDNGQTRLY